MPKGVTGGLGSLLRDEMINSRKSNSFELGTTGRMIKRNKNSQSLSVGDMWKLKIDHAMANISLTLLLYLFGSDDGVISAKEKRVFKKVWKQKREYLTFEDLDRLLEHTKSPLSKDGLVRFMKNNAYSTAILRDASKEIDKYINKNEEYMDQLDRLIDYSKAFLD